MALVLAAGRAQRFGKQKLLVPLRGRPLIRHTVEQMLKANIGEVLVVTGAEHIALADALRDLPIKLIANPQPEGGLSASLKVGVEAAGRAAVLVNLGDQPTVPVATLRALVSTYRTSGASIVCPVYRGELGNPVLFAPDIFSEILQLTGDRGARQVVERDASRVAVVKLEFAMPRDVDTPNDLLALELT